MSKKQKASDKVLSVRVPEPLFDKFKEFCDENYKSMSDMIRDYMRVTACGGQFVQVDPTKPFSPLMCNWNVKTPGDK